MSSANIPSISAQEYLERKRQGESMVLIDVRTAAEYREGHIPTARLQPLDELNEDSLEQELKHLQTGSERQIVLTCHSGFRAQQAYERMRNAGYRNLALLQGGTEAWKNAGYPLNRCSQVISLERQVQIAIGSLLLLKVIFGFTVHEVFFLLGAVIGAGLIVAGMTRWCGMARLVAAMPWNRETNCVGKEPA